MYINIEDNIDYISDSSDGKYVYWLNLNDGKVYKIDNLEYLHQLESIDESKLYEIGYIKLPKISFMQTQKNFVTSLNDMRLTKRLLSLNDESFTLQFWKLVDDGSYMLGQWYQFLNREKAQSLVDWCNSNNIKYTYK